MGGRPTYPEREFRERQRLFVRAHLVMLARLVVVAVAVMSLLTFLVLNAWPRTMWTGWMLGAGHTAVLSSFLLVVRSVHFSRDPDAIRLYRGALGESSTTDVLRRAQRRRLVWGVVHGLTTGSGDIDHLVITRRAGIWAVDSKYLSTADHLSEAAAAARRGAARAQAVLRSTRHLARDTTARHRTDTIAFSVRPLVVLWGGVTDVVGAETDVDGVRFVRGHDLLAFIHAQSGESVSRPVASAMVESLEEFGARVSR